MEGLTPLNMKKSLLPEPKQGEARVKIEVSGVNFIDIYHRLGRYQTPLPLTLGQEAAGTVEAVGPNVTEVKPGDRVVFASVQGTYAEYAIAPAWRLIQIPTAVNPNQAVAIMVQGMTAHYLTHSTYPLKKGETALVHAAGGGTGQLLVQIAKLCGARVIGTASTPKKPRLPKRRARMT